MITGRAKNVNKKEILGEETIRTNVYGQLEDGAHFELDRRSLKEKVNSSTEVDYVNTLFPVSCVAHLNESPPTQPTRVDILKPYNERCR